MTGEHPLYYVVSVPGALASDAAIDCVARWLESSRYDAKMKLARPLPQILRAMSNRGDAVELQMELESVGVTTRCLAHRQIVHSPRLFQAVACDTSGDAIRFACKEEELFSVSSAEAKVMVRARIRERTETRRVARRAVGALTSRHAEAYHNSDTTFVLYLYAAGPRAFKIVQNEFDYDCLGGGKSMSSLRNFDTLVRLLRARFKHAVYDEALCTAATELDKTKDTYAGYMRLTGGTTRERSRTFTDERFVREAAWMIALARSKDEWP